jgi:hypothetical protein
VEKTMTVTITPPHAVALRERLEQIHGSITTLESDKVEADRAAEQALERGSTDAIVKAQSRASAVRDALATRRRTAETIAAELAQAEAVEVREAMIRSLIEVATGADKALTRYDVLLAEESGRLSASLLKLLTARVALTRYPSDAPPTAAATDRVAEYIAARNRAAAARSNPLFPNRDPNNQPPAPTGNPVADFLARRNWAAARRPNPLAR